MNKRLPLAAAALVAVFATPAMAELPVGSLAPDFTTTGALGGQTFQFHLADALKKGPVVLYFYPKSFTSGCTLEAHAFADAMDDFHKAGANVIGLSADDTATQVKFSSEECRSKFPVGTASKEIILAYDTKLVFAGVPIAGRSGRTTYVISRDDRVTMVYDSLDWREHVKRALAAVK